MKRMIETRYASTLEELADIVKKYSAVNPADTIYVQTMKACIVGFALIEETLSDGSKVYNIEVY